MYKLSRTNSKKGFKSFISLLLVAAIVITGALAYLTATDSKTNTFTVGNVAIELTEPNWVDANGLNIVPGETVAKDPTIKNTGRNDAYVYAMITIPKADGVDVNENGTVTSQDDYQLFTYEVNEGWTLIDSKVDSGDVNNYYLYAYNTALTPDQSTPAVFDEVTFGNITEGQIASDEYINILVDAYAIQSDYYNGEATNATEAWDLYTNQNGWAFPENLAGVHYKLVSYDGSKSQSEPIADDQTTIDLPATMLTNELPDNLTFVGWATPNGTVFDAGTTINVSDVQVINGETNELSNESAVIKEIVSFVETNDNASAESEFPVKLMPLNEQSTAVIERGYWYIYGRNNINIRDNFAEYTESYSTEKFFTINSNSAIDGYDSFGAVTEEYNYTVEADETFDFWFVYGLEENLAIEDLFGKYLRVQGDGYAKVTASGGGVAGTGTLIEIYDRNGTDETTDDTLVEKFYVIIYGDVNGDGVVDIVDSTKVSNAACGFSPDDWDKKNTRVGYILKAADISEDYTITGIDMGIVRGVVDGSYILNQVTTETVYIGD